MNYPIWDIPASGLLIAFVAIVHVFVSHFAVGGGLFLVVTERKARREDDALLLDYVKAHSRFFAVLTLVFGAITGVGIWFTIGLVHPAATSSLINAFVWGWAIEWTFFLTEIAAAIVYYYGWDRLTEREHLIVGWIYFGAAWLSLVVINGILSFMLTPGAWLATHGFWDGFFNPTYWPSLVIRTLGSIGLAGVYALMTISWFGPSELRPRLSRYAVTRWVLPMAIGLPLGLLWYFNAAGGAGVPLREIFGAAGDGLGAVLSSVLTTVTTGYTVAQRALKIALVVAPLTIVLSFVVLALVRRGRFARLGSVAVMIAAFLSVGTAEWVREDLRKPYVIGSYMFVNGTRLPTPDNFTGTKPKAADAFSIDAMHQTGVLAASRWAKVPEGFGTGATLTVAEEVQAGREVFKVLCARCHTVDGYLPIRPLVKGKSANALEGVIDRLAVPLASAKQSGSWSQPDIQLVTWRGRRMPPFAGNDAEHWVLAVYLASLGGGDTSRPIGSHPGAKIFDAQCSMCHGEGGEWPIEARAKGKTEDQLFAIIADLPARNDAMPPFDGTEEQRHELAGYLHELSVKAAGGQR